METTLQFFQQGLWLAVVISAPPLIAATLCGVAVSLVQAVTQVQDQTLPYSVKLFVTAISLVFLGRWMGGELIQLANLAFTMIPSVGR